LQLPHRDPSATMSQPHISAVMSNTPQPASVEQTPAIGHLTVRPEGLGPAEVHFSFERQEKRLGNALGASVLSHGALLLLFIIITSLLPERVHQAILPDRLPPGIVWVQQEGPGGGGGGGGNQMKEPPKKAELPGKDKITVPVVKPPAMELKKPEPEPEPPQEVTIPAQTMAAAQTTAPGLIESQAPATASQGTGTGGAGTGVGTGMGPGQGSGLGPGWGGGAGGGAYRPGNGVENPRLLREVKPQYTAEAMRAKIQGAVWLECVVLPDGTVGEVRVLRSLDSTFGLDLQAINAAKQWRFQPGTRFGEPVPVLVSIELTFTLR
jgi:periplasmic protein TonB